MLWFGHQWNEERGDMGGYGGYSLRRVKMYLTCGSMLKKKLLALLIELIVILNHLAVIRL